MNQRPGPNALWRRLVNLVIGTPVERGQVARRSRLTRWKWGLIGVCCPIAGACLSFTYFRTSEPDAEPLEIVALLGAVVAICLAVSIGCLFLLEAKAKVSAFSVAAAVASLTASYGTLICIVVLHAMWEPSGEARMWLPIAVLFGVPMLLPIVLATHLGAAIIVGRTLGVRSRGLMRK